MEIFVKRRKKEQLKRIYSHILIKNILINRYAPFLLDSDFLRCV